MGDSKFTDYRRNSPQPIFAELVDELATICQESIRHGEFLLVCLIHGPSKIAGDAMTRCWSRWQHKITASVQINHEVCDGDTT